MSEINDKPKEADSPKVSEPPKKLTHGKGMAAIAGDNASDPTDNQAKNVTEANVNNPAIIEPGDWSLPANVSPSEIKVYPRSDGKTQIIYGDDRNESGKITGKHGHTVINQDGEIDYARTQNGTVKKDTGE